MPTGLLRDLPPVPANWKDLMNNRLIFEVQRGNFGGEIEYSYVVKEQKGARFSGDPRVKGCPNRLNMALSFNSADRLRCLGDIPRP